MVNHQIPMRKGKKTYYIMPWKQKGEKNSAWLAGVFLFVGGTSLKRGSLSELPKAAFFNKIFSRNRSFGECLFFVLASWNLTDRPKTSMGGGWGNLRQCNVDVAVAQKQKHLHMRKEWWKKLFVAGWGLLIGGTSFYLWGGQRSRGVAFLSSQKQFFLK